MQKKIIQTNQPLDVLKILNLAIYHLNRVGVKEARLESEILLSHVLGVKKIELYLDSHILSSNKIESFIKLFNRRVAREPLSYIIGHKEFWSIDLKIDKNVLIPRPETECLVRSVVPFLDSVHNTRMKVLDIGTGSGAIILALANEIPLHDFYALDISYDAICLAKSNAYYHKLDKKINFFVSYWTNAIKSDIATFDLIVSNPPYVKSGDLTRLQPEVSFYEPHIALDGGEDGLNCFRHIIKECSHYLRQGGLLAIEIGWNQKENIMNITNLCGGYSNIKVIKDYSGFDRIIHMQKK